MIRVVFVTPEDGHRSPRPGVMDDNPHIQFTEVRPSAIREAVASVRPHVVWADARDPESGLRLDPIGTPDTPVLLSRAAIGTGAESGWVHESPPDIINRAWHHDHDGRRMHAENPDAPPVRGHACFRRHRMFGGIGGGVHTWRPRDGEPFRAWTWLRPEWPAGARVIAVERSGMRVNPARATIWEYPRSAGHPRTLCIGAYLPLESEDPWLRPRVLHLLNNALLYLAGRIPEGMPDLYWEVPDPRAFEDDGLDLPLMTAAHGDTGPLPLGFGALQRSGAGSETAFTAAGTRTLITGDQGGGAREIWMHPIRVAMGLQPTGARCTGMNVTPLGVERALRLGEIEILERICVPGDTAAAIIEYTRTDHPGPREGVAFRLDWISDLRLMWPYPADSTGPLLWRVEGDRLLVRSGRTGESVCTHALVIPGTSADPAAAGEQPDTGRELTRFAVRDVLVDTGPAAGVRCSLSCRLHPGDRLRVLMAAGVDEGDDPAAILHGLGQATSRVRARSASLRRLQRERLSVTAEDERVGLAIEWDKVRLDSCLVEAPSVGRALMAGYAAARPEPHAGLPGLAWRFDHVSIGPVLAALACGSFDAVRDTLSFLGAHQDLTGRILHECTTSGALQYDAADSTPLYLVLVARYFAWTGDTGFIRSQWQSVSRALESCLLTYREGEAWAGILRELAVTAESIGEAPLAARLRSRAETAHTTPTEPDAGPIPGNVPGLAAGPDLDDGLHPAAGPAVMGVAPFVYGLLGAEPDAFKGRLRLRPRIPEPWNRLEVRNLRMGDANLGLRYEREGSTHGFRLEQEEGAVPVRVILEAVLERTPSAMTVDGQPASLQVRPFGDRILVPVQLVLDHARHVEFDVAVPR